MLTTSITDGVLFLTPLLLIYSFTFLIFFKFILTMNVKGSYFDKLTMLTNQSTSFFLCFLVLLNTLYPFLIQFFLFNNYNFFLINFTIYITFYLVYILYNIFFQKVNFYKDYFFSLINLIFAFPYLFLVNNFFSFIFVLEYINTLIFYKLISSKLNKVDVYKKYTNYYPSKKYVNIIFFQFWTTFFSNMFFFYFFIYMLYKVGSTEWVFLNFTLTLPTYTLKSEWLQITFMALILIISVFLKLGSAPLHLFKVEIYDGLPYLSILVYTTFYISVFFIFLLYFLSHLCFSLYTYIIMFLAYLLTVGLMYLVFNSIFNIQMLKTFFAYSTILNIAFFFVVFVTMTL